MSETTNVRTISVSCETEKHDRCGGKTHYARTVFVDEAGVTRRWTQRTVPCACLCHVRVVETYTNRAGERINVLSDGTTERLEASP